MSDAFTRIFLTAQGGDNVAREVNKIKKAYEDTAKAGKEIGKIGPKGGIGKEVDSVVAEMRQVFKDAGARQEYMDKWRNAAQDREDRNKAQGAGRAGRLQTNVIESGARTTGGFLSPLAGTQSDSAQAWGTASSKAGEYFKGKAHEYHQRIAARDQGSAASPSSSGGGTGGADPTESARAAGSGMSNFGKTLPYIGALFAAGGIAMNLISTIAKQELGKAQAAWGSGMAQRLGTSYQTMRSERIILGREGIPISAGDAYYSALGQAGGSGLSGGRSMARMAMAYGLDPGVVGRTVGLRQQAGLSNMQEYMLGTENVPQGLMTRYMSTISSVIEEGMKRGMKKGAVEIENLGKTSANTINSLMSPQGGNLTYTGAEALSNTLNQQYMTSGSMVQSGEQAMRFLRYRKPGESYLQTMARIQNPSEMIPAEMQYAKKITGGDSHLMEMQLTGMWGGTMTPQQIQAMMASSEMLMGRQSPGRYRSMTKAMDASAAGIYSTMQQDILQGAGPTAVNLLSKLNDATYALFDVAKGISNNLRSIAHTVGSRAGTTSR